MRRFIVLLITFLFLLCSCSSKSPVLSEDSGVFENLGGYPKWSDFSGKEYASVDEISDKAAEALCLEYIQNSFAVRFGGKASELSELMDISTPLYRYQNARLDFYRSLQKNSLREGGFTLDYCVQNRSQNAIITQIKATPDGAFGGDVFQFRLELSHDGNLIIADVFSDDVIDSTVRGIEDENGRIGLPNISTSAIVERDVTTVTEYCAGKEPALSAAKRYIEALRNNDIPGAKSVLSPEKAAELDSGGSPSSGWREMTVSSVLPHSANESYLAFYRDNGIIPASGAAAVVYAEYSYVPTKDAAPVWQSNNLVLTRETDDSPWRIIDIRDPDEFVPPENLSWNVSYMLNYVYENQKNNSIPMEVDCRENGELRRSYSITAKGAESLLSGIDWSLCTRVGNYDWTPGKEANLIKIRVSYTLYDMTLELSPEAGMSRLLFSFDRTEEQTKYFAENSPVLDPIMLNPSCYKLSDATYNNLSELILKIADKYSWEVSPPTPG